ncbi:MAG: GDCCVxC domain-containing (seleno)protein [Thiolinea sp.]
MPTIILECTLTCPSCQTKESLTMVQGRSESFFTCTHCSTTHLTKLGECCIYCSYGTVSCPTIQSIVTRRAH